jgi:hypothetical protein
MRVAPGLRAAVLGAAVGVAATAGMVGSALRAPEVDAQALHRVGVVVDTGSGTISRCVRFSESSLTGVEVLNRAGLAPVVRAFSGQGGAVCALNGVGCPADSTCLTCQAPNYWAYYRADAGAGAFTYSQTGAGNVAVDDGDVEGWRWGTGAPPGFRPLDQICPLTPAPTPTTSASPNDTADTGGTGGTGGSPPAGEPSDTPSTTVAGSTGTTVATPTTLGGTPAGSPGSDGRDEGTDAVDGDETAARTDLADPGGSGGAGTWVAFVGLLAAFGVAGWQVRRLRTRR